MGRVMASWDWSTTSVGPPQHWPRALRQVVQILLTSRFSMWMAWGPELAFFYNDAYRRDTLQAKHPWALGRPAWEVWAEIWDDIGPRISSVLETGAATWDESLLLFLERAGYVEESYHTFSYSPLHDEAGQVAGLLCVVSEDTDRVLGERRLRILSELGDISAVTAPTVADACTAALDVLRRHRADVPFASIYLFEPDERSARRAGCYGLVDDPAIVPEVLDRRTAPDDPLWSLVDSGTWQVLDTPNRAETDWFVPLDPPLAGRDPESVVAVPLAAAGGGRPIGVIFAGLSPFRAWDGEYGRFVDLMAGQVENAIADADVYQAQLRRADELAALDRAKTEFFTGVSHELRTPLTLIAGPAEDGLADLDEPLPPAQRSRMEVIARNSGRLRRLVDTLLEFAGLEDGGLVPERIPVDLAALTRGIAESFAPASVRVGLQFDVDCPQLPSAVAMDPDMWERIVLNLLSNAVKYTPSGSVRVGLRLQEDSGGVELTVADTGIGIPAVEHALLFERFHRVRGAAGRSHEGSGIGLALVAELIALLGGTVGVESVPGRGSVFTVALPASAMTDAMPAPAEVSGLAGLYRQEVLQWGDPQPTGGPSGSEAAAPAGSPTGARVLVVEDNQDLRRFLVGLLSPHYTVLEAPDGVTGLDRIRGERPDLVLTDVMMPGLDGFELLAALRADPAVATTPVIMLSARAGEDATVGGLAAGADDYLVKPFSSHDLLARVRSNLAMARLRSDEGVRRTALFNALLDGLFVADATGSVIEINTAFVDVLGYGPEGLPYPAPHPWWPDPDRDPVEFAQVETALQAAREAGNGRFLLPLRHLDGRRIWVDCSASVVPGVGTDGPVLVGVVRDVTDEHRAAERDRLLTEAGRLLSRPGDLTDRLRGFTRLAAPVLADLTAIALARPDGRLAPIAAGHRTRSDPAAAAALRIEPYRVPDELVPRHLAGRAFVPDAATGPFPAQHELVVPLVVARRLLGTLTFATTEKSHTPDEADVVLAEELGRRVAGIVEAHRVATREHHLHIVTTALAGAATLVEAASALAGSLRTVVGATGVAVWTAPPDDVEHLHLTHLLGVARQVEPGPAVLAFGAPAPAAAAARTRTPVWLHDLEDRAARFPDRSGSVAAGCPPVDDGEQAVAALPMLIQNRVVGVLVLVFPGDRVFPAEERAFTMTLVAQAAQAFDRAATADARRQIAETLQHGLLPAGLPTHPALAMAVRYLPAGQHTAAGGDWYDVSVLDDQHVAITVGDVVGQGSRAAAVMGQLRSALAAYLLESHAPAHALQWLSRFARTIEGARGSTAVCLVLHTGTGELHWARAGHPPPLLLEPAGTTRFLDGTVGSILGVAGSPPITEGRTRLGPGSTVLLYTDGLVERRGEDIDEGLVRLAKALAGHPTTPVADLVPAVVEAALLGSGPVDDVAIVAVRLRAAPLVGRRPARAEQLSPVRRQVAVWAGGAALTAETVDDLQFALGEALTNIVDHAYAYAATPTEGDMDYRVEIGGDDRVRVEVRDEGAWRAPPDDPGYRGRGLTSLEAISEELVVLREPGGTTVRFTLPTYPNDLAVPAAPALPALAPRTGSPEAAAAVRVVERGGGIQILLSGELDLATVPTVRTTVLQALADATGPVEIDLQDVTFLASAGVGLLLDAADAGRGAALRVAGHGPAARVARLTGVDKAFR